MILCISCVIKRSFLAYLHTLKTYVNFHSWNLMHAIEGGATPTYNHVATTYVEDTHM